MTNFGVEKLTHLSASQENFLTQLNLDTGHRREISGPVTKVDALLSALSYGAKAYYGR